jgi:hypothetical protein
MYYTRILTVQAHSEWINNIKSIGLIVFTNKLSVFQIELFHGTDQQHAMSSLPRVPNFIDVDGGIFETVLY